jgi:ATP-dependent DNA helicase DinG
MTADERFETSAMEEMRRVIADAGGNEVFMIGRIGITGRVSSITVGARGTVAAVPILRPHLSEGDIVIHNHPSGELTPSKPDFAIAAGLGNEGIGFAIVDNAVTRVYVVAEPVGEKETAPIDTDRLARELAPDGGLSRVYPMFEERKSQIGMLRLVCDAFNGEEIAAVEAGTGVGKSLAYLLPAVSWVVSNGDRVIISTNTINLQQQLVEKDIPLVKRILDEDPKVVLVKGRGNYLCLNRLREALDELSLFREEDGELEAIQEWSRTTQTGSRTDLSFYPDDDTWSRVCSEADSCLGLRCSLREGCFVLFARRDAASAKLLVANHHLLFSDLALRLAGSGFDDPAVLPPFRRIVFDEAHNIEKAATSFFSRGFSHAGVLKILRRIYGRKNRHIIGHYPALMKRFGKTAVASIPDQVREVQEKTAELDAACLGLMGEEGNFLLDGESVQAFKIAASPLANLSASIGVLNDTLSGLFESATEEDSENLVWDCRVQARRLSGIIDVADRFRDGPKRENQILWMESVRGRKEERHARLAITPLDVSPLMREAIFEPLKTVVLTSATLTVAGKFEFWAGRIGLSGVARREPIARSFPSPFDFRHNVLLGIPTDAPAPDQPEYRKFLPHFIEKALLASNGAGLVLFTSYALLREAYQAVQPILSARGIRILKQGDDDRARLLEKFRDETSSVLFATDSFWEGVDAPGETLQIVILCRLPFRVPSEPILRARMAAIEESGGNSFTELSLPDAVVRLRQGFGRLMRRHSDRGVVLILDSRIVSKRYGSVFLDSLPGSERVIAGGSDVLRSIEAFFDRGEKKEPH